VFVVEDILIIGGLVLMVVEVLWEAGADVVVVVVIVDCDMGVVEYVREVGLDYLSVYSKVDFGF